MLTDTAGVRVTDPADLPRPPRFATRRNPALRTRGGKVGVLAAEMGKSLLPHQQYIADVGTELNPPGSEYRFRYQLVIVSLPRQAGKTTLMRPIFLDRALTTPGLQAFMTAQLGKDAAARWEDMITDLEMSPLFRSFMTVRRGKGDQRCTFPNASFIAPFAPELTSLHGYSPPLVLVDEGWAFSAEAGRDLMRAIRPAQITKKDRQLWIISAAGDTRSEWWNELVEAGRRAVDDPNARTAYFEWSMDETLDPYDPASWEYHPGLEGLITLADLAEEAKPENNTHADFLRGFMNIPTKVRDTTVLDLDAWDGLAAEQTPPDPARVAYAYDVAIDRTAASVWGAWRDDAGMLHLHVREVAEGADWLPEYIANLYAETGATIGADDGGPARVVTDQLRRANIPVEVVGGKDGSTAWGAIKAAVRDGTLRHDGSPALRAALEVAVERPVGDAIRLSRRHSLGPIDAAIAASTAGWLADRLTSGIPIYF